MLYSTVLVISHSNLRHTVKILFIIDIFLFFLIFNILYFKYYQESVVISRENALTLLATPPIPMIVRILQTTWIIHATANKVYIAHFLWFLTKCFFALHYSKFIFFLSLLLVGFWLLLFYKINSFLYRLYFCLWYFDNLTLVVVLFVDVKWM